MKDDQMAELIDDRSASRRWPVVVVGFVILVILGLIAWDERPWAGNQDATDGLGMLSDETPRRDGNAPDFALHDEAGNRVSLSDYEGRPVFLNFWATWCTFCKEEMPDMQRVQDEYGEDLVVIGVNVGDSIDDGEAFARRAGITYVRLYDRSQEITDGYLVQAMPTSYFIRSDGTISDANFGFMVYDQMIDEIEKSRSTERG